jgi:hypothetical protein
MALRPGDNKPNKPIDSSAFDFTKDVRGDIRANELGDSEEKKKLNSQQQAEEVVRRGFGGRPGGGPGGSGNGNPNPGVAAGVAGALRSNERPDVSDKPEEERGEKPRNLAREIMEENEETAQQQQPSKTSRIVFAPRPSTQQQPDAQKTTAQPVAAPVPDMAQVAQAQREFRAATNQFQQQTRELQEQMAREQQTREAARQVAQGSQQINHLEQKNAVVENPQQAVAGAAQSREVVSAANQVTQDVAAKQMTGMSAGTALKANQVSIFKDELDRAAVNYQEMAKFKPQVPTGKEGGSFQPKAANAYVAEPVHFDRDKWMAEERGGRSRGAVAPSIVASNPRLFEEARSGVAMQQQQVPVQSRQTEAQAV